MAARLGFGLLVGLALGALSASPAWGQEMEFGEEETTAPAEGGESEGASMEFGTEEAEGGTPEEGAAEGEAGGEDVLGGLAGEQPTTAETGPEEPLPVVEPAEVWAVQRVYALRNRRFEIVPRFGFSLNDQFVSHYGFGGQLNWYITDVLALGLEGIWFYYNPESDVNYYTSRSFRVVVPINEYWMGWYLNFSYVPFYGKFAIFNRWIFHWDTFIQGGLGVTMTRPLAVVDSEFRSFNDIEDWNVNVTFSLGIGGRTFITRWLAIFAELRMYGFPQPLEERRIAALNDPCPQGEQSGGNCTDHWEDERANPDTWLDTDGEFAVNVMVQFGLSFFLPPTFTYRLPK